MDEIKRIEVAEFVSTPAYMEKARPKTARTGKKRGDKRRRIKRRRVSAAEPAASPSSMLIKLGVCSAAFALVLLLKWIDTPFTNGAYEQIRSAVTSTDEELDEMLGKLKFVQLPGILDVFSTGAKFALPVDYANVSLNEAKTMLTLTSSKDNSVVKSSGKGYVSDAGLSSGEETYFVCVMYEDDIAVTYTGLSELKVERGQPVQKLDHLGVLSKSASLTVAVSAQGRPQNPEDYFDVNLEDA